MNMSDGPTPTHTDQPPPPPAVPIMDIKAPAAADGEAGLSLLPAAPSAKAGSVVSISDSDTEGPVASVARISSAAAGEDHGTKRPAESEASGGIAKKSKTSAVKKEPEKEQTVEEIKEKANARIAKICGQREQYKSDLEDTQKQLAAAEECRNELRAAMIAYEQKELVKVADRKAKATREKDWRNKTISKLKAELQQDYDEKLAIKIRSIERRLGGRYATAERNLAAKLDDKTEKLEAVGEELRELKVQSREEIRDLKALAKEQAKIGGPRAQLLMRNCQNDLKEKEKELAAAYGEIDSLKKQIIHHKAEINAEKTQKNDLADVYTKTCTDNQALSIKAAEWKQRCALLMKDTNVSNDNHAIELRDLRAAHKYELREMDKKWEIQAANSAESQQRVVASQRTVFSLTNANNKLMKDNESYQKQLQATAAEKRQKEERCRELGEKLARLGASPSAVAKLEQSAKMQGVEGEVSAREMDEVATMQVSEADAQQQIFGGVSTAAGSSAQSEFKAGNASWSFPPMS